MQRLPGMAAGLADIPIAAVSGARPVTAAADAIGKATGFQPGKWADETKFSAGHEQGRKAVDEAWEQGDVGSIAKAYLQNPGYTAGQVAESLPGMVAGLVLRHHADMKKPSGEGLCVLQRVSDQISSDRSQKGSVRHK